MNNTIGVVAPNSVIGRNFIDFIEDEYKVITIGRNNCDIYWDLSDGRLKELPKDIDCIISFAGIIFADSDEEIIRMIEVNTVGALKICMAAEKIGVKHVIIISSISSILSSTSDYYGYYSLSKKYAEKIVDFYGKNHDISICVVRPSQVFGCDDKYGKSQKLLYEIIHAACENKDIVFWGRNDAIRNYIYDKNLFNMLKEIIARRHQGVIDVINKKNYTLSEIASGICEAFDSTSEITFDGTKKDISDNGFFLRKDYFLLWDVPYVDFFEAIKAISVIYK